MGVQHTEFYNPLLTNPLNPTLAAFSEQPSRSDMPTWLRSQKTYLVTENMEMLREAMLESMFTESEISKVFYAIQEGSNGDRNKMAGAAEFCLIMVETMEMELSSLIAGAFHYCSCVAARERYPDQSDLSRFELRQHHGIESFGEEAVQIERDSARLKRLEVVASLVVHSTSNSHRVTPDMGGADNLRNLFVTEAKDWRALAIRGAACLYRLRGLLKSGTTDKLTKESSRVCREALKIYAPLASRLGMHRLKNELEEYAFRMLYRRQYETVTALLHQTRGNQNLRLARKDFSYSASDEPDIGESMERVLAQVQSEMTELLENDPEFGANVESFSVTARVKESYSTWKKMLRTHSNDILQVPDALALRVVLNAKKDYDEEPEEIFRDKERELCYYAQQLCMERWAPLVDEPRLKDYIAQPKPNGYQSLHYTAQTEWHSEEWTMEIQVRSEQMHKVAEFGVASHWEYKMRGKAAKTDEHFGKVSLHEYSDGYLRSLQEYHWEQHGRETTSKKEEEGTIPVEPLILSDEADTRRRAERIRARTQRLAPYIEALTEAQSDLARENVFIFLSQSEDADSGEGKVVALPAGAVVLDAIRYCELPALPDEPVQHNGAPAALTSRLNNGDVLSIPSLTACVTASM
jgi:(p)ppGpp synthase/HD superfamily hydrolase